MIGNFQDSMSYIEESEQLEEAKSNDPDNESAKLKVQTLVDNLILGEKLSLKTTAGMNKAAILLCAGNLYAAKQQLDELLKDANVTVITDSNECNGMIPSYLIQLLVYFLLKTSKSICIIISLCDFCRKLQACKTPYEIPSLHYRYEPHRPCELTTKLASV